MFDNVNNILATIVTGNSILRLENLFETFSDCAGFD